MSHELMTFSNCYRISNDVHRHRKKENKPNLAVGVFSLFRFFVTKRKNVGNIISRNETDSHFWSPIHHNPEHQWID